MFNNIKWFVLLVSVCLLSLKVPDAHGQFFLFENPMVDKPAPDFTLKTASGKSLNFTKYREGKNAVIFFWATWCPHCHEEMQTLKTRQKELADKQIKVGLVDLGEDAKTVNAYLKKYQISFDVFLDENSTIAEPYHLIGVPTFVFVNQKGIIVSVEHALAEDYVNRFTPQNSQELQPPPAPQPVPAEKSDKPTNKEKKKNPKHP